VLTLRFLQTEGLLSAAVQPPGSGSHLSLPSTAHQHGSSSLARDQHSDMPSTTGSHSVGDDSVATDAMTESEKTDGSANGQGEMTQAGGVSQQEQDVIMYDEEPDEDRLIAQGGIGIPIGPVCLTYIASRPGKVSWADPASRCPV
jgi:hypothetical protein